jgi:hypothetical protein|tara:strand:- start:105 stop:404 length:300 start_codon:yes stop_codon:yes gene_type:complete
MSKLTEKYDKMYNMIEVSVVHKAFREEPKEVAQVWVDKNLNINQILDKAFMLTNSIDDAWWNNKDVVCLEKTRSTMSGDQVIIKGHTYECMDRGWRTLG